MAHWFASLLSSLTSSADKNAGTVGYQSISPAQAKEKMEGTQPLVVLDVREPWEYSQGHIPGSKLLPVGQITSSSAAQTIPQLDTPVLVYCRSGNRSKKACAELAKLGYSQVYDLGGIQNWPYPIEK